MRVLIVSRHFPNRETAWAIGVFKRFKMFVDAIKDFAEIDLLYYVPNGVNTSSSSVKQIGNYLSKYFNTPIRLSLCKRSENRNLITKLDNYITGVFYFYRQSNYYGVIGTEQVQAFETCLSYNPDAIFVHRLGAMCPILRTRKKLPPIFLDLDDIESIALRRGIRYITKTSTKLLNYLMLPALYLGQFRSIRLSHRTFVCSEIDRLYLTKRCRLKGVTLIPNGIAIPDEQPIATDPRVLFIGSYSHKPNSVAAEFLIKKIWPFVHKQIPKSTLIIAGSSPDRIPSFGENTPGVTFTGFVEDLEDLYKKSRVVCAPILSGSGTRIKIIEAAAYGKPIVSTAIGAEGLEMNNGHEIFLCDDPKSFAEACIKLLNDHELCTRVGMAARLAVINKYDRKMIKSMIQEYIKISKVGENQSNTFLAK